MEQRVDLLLINAAQVITCAAPEGPKRGLDLLDAGIIRDGAVAIDDGVIVDVGLSTDLVGRYPARTVMDVGGKVICPGFVDCHTHAVYAGERIAEFELRVAGQSYQEIMAAGGGILSTMAATRAASQDELAAAARNRLHRMLRLGTTTVEIKTGYGLDAASELAMLQAIDSLAQELPLDIVPTILAAHVVPPEFAGRAQDYVDLIAADMLPRLAAWYDTSWLAGQGMLLGNDVFCEQHAFDVAQSRQVLEAGAGLGLPGKIHVDQFTALGGLEMAAKLGVLSADHLDVTTATSAAALAASSAIGVLMPAVNFNLGSTHFADGRGLIDAGVAVALATDINPGSAPCPSMPMVMALACRYNKLLPSEALNAATINAAHALGLGDSVGSLEPGKQADLLIIHAADYRYLAYEFGDNPVETVIKRGVVLP